MATLTFEIELTNDDIGDGAKGNCELCPIALAATRAIGLPARVGWNRIFVDGYAGEMPEAAKQFVKNFDAGRPTETLKFTIEMRPFKHSEEAIFADAAKYVPPAPHEPKGDLLKVGWDMPYVPPACDAC